MKNIPNNYTFFPYLIGLLLMLSVVSCSRTNKTKELKLAHCLDQNHPVHKGMVFMAERLEEKSGRKLTMEIYPNSQLGSEQQCVELLQIGSLAITKVSAAILESFTRNFQVLGLPYIFRSREHLFNVLDGDIGQEFLLSTEQYNIRGLCFYDAGARSFYTIDKPIATPDDLDGLKVRVMKSQTAMNLVKALGGSPTPISWGELYTALQSGVVDGAENNPPSFYSSRHYEVCKNFIINEHTRVPDVMIMSTVVWESLNNQERKWLQEAADESVIAQRRFWEEFEKESLQKVQEAGVKISYPDKAPFAEKVQDMIKAYKDSPELYSLIQRIQEHE